MYMHTQAVTNTHTYITYIHAALKPQMRLLL